MASTRLRAISIPSFTVVLGIWACFVPGADDQTPGSDATDGEVPGGSGGAGYATGGSSCGASGESASSAGGRTPWGGFGGESGSSVDESPASGGFGGDVAISPPLAACPETPDAPDAPLLRVPAVLPGGATGSTVGGLSADGATIVGAYAMPVFPEDPARGHRYFAFRWSVASGLVPLDAPGAQDSYARAASADGSVIAGSIHRPDTIGERAVVWTSDGMRELELLPDATTSDALAISDDGAVVVGLQKFIEFVSPQRWVPVRWTSTGIEVLDHPLPNGASALGASSDGAAVAGNLLGSHTPVRWMGSAALQQLLAPAGAYAEAGDISGDGAVVVGWASFPDRTAPVRWDGQQAELLAFADGEYSQTAQAFDADADGSTIVGVSEGEASVWERAHGTRRLSSILAYLGTDLSSWHLSGATISADGRVLAGSGRCGNRERGFLVRLPAETAIPEGTGADAGDAGLADAAP